jgi:hypothetical protein
MWLQEYDGALLTWDFLMSLGYTGGSNSHQPRGRHDDCKSRVYYSPMYRQS